MCLLCVLGGFSIGFWGNHNGHKGCTMCTKKIHSVLCDNMVSFVVNKTRETNASNDVHLAQILTYTRLAIISLGNGDSL